MGQEIAVPVPDLEDLGPAMRALNDRQRKFVIAYFHTGKRETAARIAGYAGEIGSDMLGVSAYAVWHRPQVQAAIREFADQSVLAGLIPLAFSAIKETLEGGDYKERTKAAQIVMDRTGFHATMEHKITKVAESREDTIKEIIRLAREQGLDPRTLIGGAVDFVDADFEIVEDGSKAGLEDLL